MAGKVATTRSSVLAVAILAVAVLLGCTAEVSSGAARPTPSLSANTIHAVRTVGAAGSFCEPGVEMEFVSARAFPVRNEIVVLRIGSHMFLRSRYAADGDTHVLIARKCV